VTTYTQKITFGEMRASGVRDVVIYCIIADRYRTGAGRPKTAVSALKEADILFLLSVLWFAALCVGIGWAFISL
jgi:hypothetical protein